ncbi:MAG: hypothetical protein ACI3YI_12505 [Bacteroidaceae bacterium]
MKKRRYPLFIIDSSRSHGRGRETDYISCTSAECPFIAEATLLNPQELEIDADWLTKNGLAVFSDPRGMGIMAKIRVVDYDPSRSSGIHSLLRRAMKEYLVRMETVSVDPSDIKSEDVVWFCDTLLGKTYENLREDPSDKQAQTVQKILAKIRDDYENRS